MSAASVAPILGNRHIYPTGVGWGQVAPTRIAMGTTAARYWLIHPGLGAVSRIRWTGWGTTTAIGHGWTRARKPGGGLYRQLVPVELRASGLSSCVLWDRRPAYSRLQARYARRPHQPLVRGWRDWPLENEETVCWEPYQPRPYVRPAPNELGIYYRGDAWTWRSNTLCVGPGVHIGSPAFAFQLSGQYTESARGTIGFGFRNFSDHYPLIPKGVAIPLRVLVASPAGRVATATISLTHYGRVTATYPDDFYRPTSTGPQPLGHRVLAPGTYTMVVETMQNTQVACSGAFVR